MHRRARQEDNKRHLHACLAATAAFSFHTKTRQDMQAFSTLMTSLARANANAYANANANANAARVMSRPFVVAGIGAEHQ